MKRRNLGFTLIEVLVALVGVVVLAVAATSFLFSILSQRDQAVVEALVAEQMEVVMAVVGGAVRSAKEIVIEDGGKSLELKSKSECFRFSWDEGLNRLTSNYSAGESCLPGSGSTELLTAQAATIENVNFSLLEPDDSSRAVMMDMTVSAYQPLANSSQINSLVLVNLVDEEGGDGE